MGKNRKKGNKIGKEGKKSRKRGKKSVRKGKKLGRFYLYILPLLTEKADYAIASGVFAMANLIICVFSPTLS